MDAVHIAGGLGVTGIATLVPTLCRNVLVVYFILDLLRYQSL